MQSALIHQVKILFLKELRSEFRNRFAINGILLQLVSSIYIVYLSFKFISPNIWSALFWIILLFTTVSGISRSFVQERQGRMLYFHTTVNPLAVLYAKIAFNTLLGLMITAIALLFFTLFMGAPDLNFLWFSALALLFALGLSILLTFLSALAAKTKAGGVIMPVLSFPLVLPLILIAISSGSMLTAGETENLWRNLLLLGLLDAMLAALAIVLFRFLWQE